MQTPILSPAELAFLEAARRAVLATLAPDGHPRLVPICFVVGADDEQGRPRLYTPIDEKPKSEPDPLRTARVRDLLATPLVAVLVDRWSEDWTELGWLRLAGRGNVLLPGGAASDEHSSAVASLRVKYPQYAAHRLEDRPMIRITVDRARSWGELGPAAGTR